MLIAAKYACIGVFLIHIYDSSSYIVRFLILSFLYRNAEIGIRAGPRAAHGTHGHARTATADATLRSLVRRGPANRRNPKPNRGDSGTRDARVARNARDARVQYSTVPPTRARGHERPDEASLPLAWTAWWPAGPSLPCAEPRPTAFLVHVPVHPWGPDTDAHEHTKRNEFTPSPSRLRSNGTPLLLPPICHPYTHGRPSVAAC